MKVCVNCKKSKHSEAFGVKRSAKDGLQSWCKQCKKELYLQNREEILEDRRAYYEENIEKIAEYKKEYNKNNREYLNSYCVEWRNENRERENEKCRKRKKDRLLSDPIFKFTVNLRRRLHHAFKGENKSKKTIELLGCDMEVAFDHIERQFKPGMSWQNYGQWHVDHIFPLASAKSIDELEKLCHYTNLQPLWAIDNFKKSSKLPTVNL